MNIEIKSPKRQQSPEEYSEASSDTYFPSNESVQQNPSQPTDFMILCPSPDLNIFDMRQAINNGSASNATSRDVNSSETWRSKHNDLGSLHSFELWNIENKSSRPRSLPKERIEVDSDIEIRSNKSAEDNLRLRLHSLVLEDMVSQAEALNKEIEEHSALPENDNQLTTTRYSSGDVVEKASAAGCNCKKSKCLRLHCICFAELRECGKHCKCAGCKNNEKSKEVRDFVIEKTREINPIAFKPKIKNYKGVNINSRGCNCTKNNCLKRYCECFKSGSGCTTLCMCVDCQNVKDDINKDDINNMKDKGYRRKHKIVINDTTLEKRGSMSGNNAVSFVKHRKKRKPKNKH